MLSGTSSIVISMKCGSPSSAWFGGRWSRMNFHFPVSWTTLTSTDAECTTCEPGTRDSTFVRLEMLHTAVLKPMP
eukprot:5258829-Prymnesium_polylepis.1